MKEGNMVGNESSEAKRNESGTVVSEANTANGNTADDENRGSHERAVRAGITDPESFQQLSRQREAAVTFGAMLHEQQLPMATAEAIIKPFHQAESHLDRQNGRSGVPALEAEESDGMVADEMAADETEGREAGQSRMPWECKVTERTRDLEGTDRTIPSRGLRPLIHQRRGEEFIDMRKKESMGDSCTL